MRALLDTSTLFPRVLRDALLDAAVADLYEPIWSAEILDELRRNWSRIEDCRSPLPSL